MAQVSWQSFGTKRARIKRRWQKPVGFVGVAGLQMNVLHLELLCCCCDDILKYLLGKKKILLWEKHVWWMRDIFFNRHLEIKIGLQIMQIISGTGAVLKYRHWWETQRWNVFWKQILVRTVGQNDGLEPTILVSMVHTFLFSLGKRNRDHLLADRGEGPGVQPANPSDRVSCLRLWWGGVGEGRSWLCKLCYVQPV